AQDALGVPLLDLTLQLLQAACGELHAQYASSPDLGPSPPRGRWQPKYLAWCPRHGAAATRHPAAAPFPSPPGLPDEHAARRVLRYCRLYNLTGMQTGPAPWDALPQALKTLQSLLQTTHAHWAMSSRRNADGGST
ncbi:hypothetical protein WJX73_009925, partial [Symbiochloris irregularis]